MKHLIFVLPLILCTCMADDDGHDSAYYACSHDITGQHNADPNRQQYQALLDDVVHAGVPGMMLGVSKPGLPVWTGAAGMADLAGGVNLQPCYLTRVGSTVKTFTAVTVLLLAEEGKLSLDDAVTRYLSPDRIRGLNNAGQATIRQLLQHTSGIYNYIVNPRFQTASLNDLTRVWQPNELLDYARGMDAQFAPGADAQYSNTNYVLLGDIITAVEKKPFYRVFQERLFEPLGLRFTRFAAEDPVPAGLIRGYADLYSNLQLINVTAYSGWDYYTADGGLISNAYDEARFMQALFSGQVLSAASLTQMMKWRTPSEKDEDGFPIAYGLGIFKIDTPYGIAYMHSGDAIGYYACMVYFPAQQTAIAWAVNGNYGSIDQFTQTRQAMERIFAAVFDS